MNFYLSIIKQFFLLLLTGESPKINHWRTDTIRPIQGIPFNVEWQVDRALFVRLKGYKKRLPASGAMLIKVENTSTVLELEAVGLFSVSKSSLPISCGDTVQLTYDAIKEFTDVHRIQRLSSGKSVQAQLQAKGRLVFPRKTFPRRLTPKYLLRNRNIRLFQSPFDPKAFNDNDQGTVPTLSNPF